jgi:hypothetical protein
VRSDQTLRLMKMLGLEMILFAVSQSMEGSKDE